MIVLTDEEHDKYIHICGKTGEYLDKHPELCENCKDLKKCLKTHSVKNVDDMDEAIRSKIIDKVLGE